MDETFILMRFCERFGLHPFTGTDDFDHDQRTQAMAYVQIREAQEWKMAALAAGVRA